MITGVIRGGHTMKREKRTWYRKYLIAVALLSMTLLVGGFGHNGLSAEEIEEPQQEEIIEEEDEIIEEPDGIIEEPEEIIVEEDSETTEEERPAERRHSFLHDDREDGNPMTVEEPKELKITVPSYDGKYDGQYHGDAAQVNVTKGTTIRYSTNDGETWTTTPPQIKRVGEIRVLVLAENPRYRSVMDDYYLKVSRKDITVAALNTFKSYGEADPPLIATIGGLVEGDENYIKYNITRDKGYEPGTYTIRVSGIQEQGNYRVHYQNGTLTINKLTGMTLIVHGYEGVYDGKEHGGYVQSSSPVNTRLSYSTDDGKTWSETAPTIRNVGTINVRVKAVNSFYEEEPEAEYTLKVTRREVVITTSSATKPYDQEPLKVGGSVHNLAEGDEVIFKAAGSQTAIGSSVNGYILNWDDTDCRNYYITEKLGTLTVTEPTPLPSAAPEREADTDNDQGLMSLLEPVVAEEAVQEILAIEKSGLDLSGRHTELIVLGALTLTAIISAAYVVHNRRH